MDALDRTLDHERVANETKHWVRLTAACNSRCVFCLDAQAQDGRILEFTDIQREIRRGREESGATRLVLSGGEGSLHPRFHDAIAYAKDVGYRWVQTVTNGQRLADRAFYLAAVAAGLDEITFSIHGHTPELHDRLTGTRNGFANLVRAMVRAIRHDKVVVNVDVCVNRQNVAHLAEIVAVCARLGVREFDLLHVIPQGEAWENRDELLYDPAEHVETLRRVFRLARHPGFHVWTNRFPVAHLEGLEELIQDPHKMLDEVGGRRVQFRKYLDEGRPIDCRDAARCPHCFVEPFCSALDRHLADQQASAFDVWWVGERVELPLAGGARWLGVSRLPEREVPLYARLDRFQALPEGSLAVLTRTEHLEQVAGPADVLLSSELCAALAGQPIPSDWRLVVPSRARAEDAALDPDWRAFFATLRPGTAVSGVPPCLAPGATWHPDRRILDASLFHDDGRMDIDAFVTAYIEAEYRVKSLRCGTCAADARCRGDHIQRVRAKGLGRLEPLVHAAPNGTLRPGLAAGAPPVPGSVRVPVVGNRPVPEIDWLPGRRS